MIKISTATSILEVLKMYEKYKESIIFNMEKWSYSVKLYS